ncbi:MAG: MscL family protein [Patescibacteria group bacterium]
MSKQLKGFIEFIKEQGVVGLAVGLAIGAQVGLTVTAIVKGLVDPIIGFIIGDTHGLSAAKFTITAGDRSMTILWGLIASSLITLLAVSALIYFFVTGLKLDQTKLKKK